MIVLDREGRGITERRQVAPNKMPVRELVGGRIVGYVRVTQSKVS
jgi:hypothetical protein